LRHWPVAVRARIDPRQYRQPVVARRRRFPDDATGVSLGALDPSRLAVLDPKGVHLRGDPPTKEAALHLAMYRERPRDNAVVHLHSTHSVAVSILEDTDPADALPPLTAYFAMRIGTLPMLPYFPPGDAALAAAVGAAAARHHAILLANHGPVVSGVSLASATDAIEELEATARLWLMVRRERVRTLTREEVAEIARRFKDRA
jgi:ribulose-5-phosphate 4-epimerase/fuculose-1-phosphate aldolase